jgi:hypothetical protein
MTGMELVNLPQSPSSLGYFCDDLCQRALCSIRCSRRSNSSVMVLLSNGLRLFPSTDCSEFRVGLLVFEGTP